MTTAQTGIKYQIGKQDIISNFNQKENKCKSQISHECMVEDKVSLESPGVLRKLSTPCTGPYPKTNVYKNGTVRIQKGKREWYLKN
jgi:hypothetical protein